MAAIIDVEFSINRNSFPGGSVCAVNYYYVIECDHKEISSRVSYSIWVEVWGKERLGDRLLGNTAYDNHIIDAEARHRESREFLIPCDLLNDRIGKDKLFLVVKARSSFGVEIEGTSQIITASF